MLYYVPEVSTPGVGGCIAQSAKQPDKLFQFPGSGAVTIGDADLSGSEVEIFSISGGGLFSIDHLTNACRKYADHHYGFAVLGSIKSIAFLMNREIAISNLSQINVWPIELEYWLDLEERSGFGSASSIAKIADAFKSKPGRREHVPTLLPLRSAG